MARICGVSGLAPREGETMRPCRLDQSDCTHFEQRYDKAAGSIEAGLYQCCEDVAKEQRARTCDKEGHPNCGKNPEECTWNSCC